MAYTSMDNQLSMEKSTLHGGSASVSNWALIQYKDIILRPSYLHNGISYTGKMTYLYWISPQMFIITNWVPYTLIFGKNQTEDF